MNNSPTNIIKLIMKLYNDIYLIQLFNISNFYFMLHFINQFKYILIKLINIYIYYKVNLI